MRCDHREAHARPQHDENGNVDCQACGERLYTAQPLQPRTTKQSFWVAEYSDGSWCAGVTVHGQDYESPPFSSEAEAEAEMRRMVDAVRDLAKRCGVSVTDVVPS